MSSFLNNSFIKLFFFGNFFYGLCAVALSIESMVQQRFLIDTILYFILIYSSTVFYYSHAYALTEVSSDNKNIRAIWYAKNRNMIFLSRVFFLCIITIITLYFLRRFRGNILMLSIEEIILFGIFPLISIFYYGINHASFKHFNLRNIGWLKPFIIGFIWAGLVTIYPALFHTISNGLHYHFTLVGIFLFIKNFMFVTILCIMFDIKDYAMDYNQQLKTFVVKMGLRRTIFYIIIPLCIVGLSAFISYGISQHFHIVKIFLNTLPFLLTILVAQSLQNRKSILYYLFIIDGLMIIKAGCGITAMLYF